jgi:alkylation response protein AidB-like acyl-CoA dehydrogenase
MRDEQASLSKAYCTVKMRESAGYAHELMGGNGILLDHQVGHFVAIINGFMWMWSGQAGKLVWFDHRV